MMKDTKQRLGFLLQNARKTKKLTQAQIADACSLSVEAISNIERGVNYPSFENLFLICERLNCPLNEILADVCEESKDKRRLSIEMQSVAVIRNLPDDELSIVAQMLAGLKK